MYMHVEIGHILNVFSPSELTCMCQGYKIIWLSDHAWLGPFLFAFLKHSQIQVEEYDDEEDELENNSANVYEEVPTLPSSSALEEIEKKAYWHVNFWPYKIVAWSELLQIV